MTSQEYLERSSQRGWKFHRTVTRPVAKNLEYIHPLKQELVNAISARAAQESCIRRIIVFGSAITNRCNPFSDLDLCVDWAIQSHDTNGVYDRRTLPFLKYISLESKGNCDVLAYDDVENKEMKRNIDEGVVVYEHDV